MSAVRYLASFAGTLAGLMAGVALFNVSVDATGIFRIRPFASVHVLDSVGRKSTTLTDRYAGRSVSLVLGSSRSTVLPPATLQVYTGKEWYNYATFGGTMEEIDVCLRYALDSGVRVDEVLIGIDYFGFTYEYTNPSFPPRRWYAHGRWNPHFWRDYVFSYAAVAKSVESLKADYAGVESSQWLDDDGLAHRVPLGDAKTIFLAPLGPYQEGTAVIPAQLDHWHDIVALTAQHGIKLTVFGSPVYWRVLTTQDFQLRRKLFAMIIDSLGHGFVDFGNFNYVTTNHQNFIDMEHYNQDTAALVIKKLYCPSCKEGADFGTYVDRSNLDDYLRTLKNALEHYSEPSLAAHPEGGSG